MQETARQEFESELRIHEALDVASTTPVFALSFLMAFAVMILQIGPSNLTPAATVSLIMLLIMNLMGMKSYYALRHKPRPKSISKRRLIVILITSLILGTCWGSFNFFMMPYLAPHEQMVLYLFAYIGAFGGATTFSLRVSWGFSSPILFLTWLAMLLWGPLEWYFNTLTILGTVLVITQLTFLTRKSAINGIKLSLANTKALNDQLKAENQVRELARIPEENPNPVMRISSDGKLLFANRASIPMLDALDIEVGAGVTEEWLARVKQGLQENERQDFECLAGGMTYTLLLWPVPDSKHVNIYGRDVTQLKLAENRMRELARIPEENPNPVLRITDESKLTYANEASSPLIKALHLKVGDHVGTDWRKHLTKGLDEDQRQDFEYEVGGRIYALLLWPVPEGGYTNVYGRDITTQKHAERELRVAKNIAEASKEETEKTLVDLKTTQASLIHAEKMASLGQLTAGIAHEIKNPLNFVNNFSKLSVEMMNELVEVLEQPINALTGEEKEDAEDLIQTVVGNLGKIEQHGRRADSIVKNMLLHSREESTEKQRIDLNTLVQEAVNLAYHGARAVDKSFNVDIQTDFSEDVADVECLPQELQRVVLNVCSNGMYEASKSAVSLGREPVLKVSTRSMGRRYEVRVADNGGGIPDEMRDKIFNPFFTTKPTGEGTGLGLSMSFDIIKQHEGNLSFETEVGQGTTFVFCLPAPIDI